MEAKVERLETRIDAPIRFTTPKEVNGFISSAKNTDRYDNFSNRMMKNFPTKVIAATNQLLPSL